MFEQIIQDCIEQSSTDNRVPFKDLVEERAMLSQMTWDDIYSQALRVPAPNFEESLHYTIWKHYNRLRYIEEVLSGDKYSPTTFLELVVQEMFHIVLDEIQSCVEVKGPGSLVVAWDTDMGVTVKLSPKNKMGTVSRQADKI